MESRHPAQDRQSRWNFDPSLSVLNLPPTGIVCSHFLQRSAVAASAGVRFTISFVPWGKDVVTSPSMAFRGAWSLMTHRPPSNFHLDCFSSFLSTPDPARSRRYRTRSAPYRRLVLTFCPDKASAPRFSWLD